MRFVESLLGFDVDFWDCAPITVVLVGVMTGRWFIINAKS